MRRKDKRSQEERDLERARECVMDHQCRDRVSRAWVFSTPSKGGHYAFTLTWSPGVLALSGDCGDLILRHYHALQPPLAAALHWAATSDIHYLFEKTDRRRSYDRDATFRELVRWANEPAIEELKALRDELRRWRDERPDPKAYRVDGLLGGDAFEEFKLEWKSWKDDKPKLALPGEKQQRTYGGSYETVVSEDGYGRWEKIRRACVPWSDATDVLTTAGRYRIKEELEGDLADENQAADLQYSKLDFDSESINCHSWTFHDLLQMTCIKQGAKLARERVLQELDREKAEAVVAAVCKLDANACTAADIEKLKQLAADAITFREGLKSEP